MDKITLMEGENSLAEFNSRFEQKEEPEHLKVVLLKFSSLKSRRKMNRTRRHTSICIVEVQEERRWGKGQTIYNI